MRAFLKTSIAAALAVLLPHSSGATQLCGRLVLPFDAMLAAITADPGTEVARKTASFVEIHDSERKMVWTLWRAREHQPAAYRCLRIIERSGYTEVLLSFACDGWTPSCDALINRLAAESGPQDGVQATE